MSTTQNALAVIGILLTGEGIANLLTDHFSFLVCVAFFLLVSYSIIFKKPKQS